MENTSEKFIHHTGGSGCLHEDAVKAIQLLLVSLCQSERPSYLLGVSLLQVYYIQRLYGAIVIYFNLYAETFMDIHAIINVQ